jgi:hypothetical protein
MSTASLDRSLFSASVSFGCAVSPASGLLEKWVRSQVRSLAVPACPVLPGAVILLSSHPRVGSGQ